LSMGSMITIISNPMARNFGFTICFEIIFIIL